MSCDDCTIWLLTVSYLSGLSLVLYLHLNDIPIVKLSCKLSDQQVIYHDWVVDQKKHPRPLPLRRRGGNNDNRPETGPPLYQYLFPEFTPSILILCLLDTEILGTILGIFRELWLLFTFCPCDPSILLSKRLPGKRWWPKSTSTLDRIEWEDRGEGCEKKLFIGWGKFLLLVRGPLMCPGIVSQSRPLVFFSLYFFFVYFLFQVLLNGRVCCLPEPVY